MPYSGEILSGGSYRLNYSKSFDELDSQVTFAGYRFSEQNFMSMSEYLDAREYGRRFGNGKEMYTITYNQQLRNLGRVPISITAIKLTGIGQPTIAIT